MAIYKQMIQCRWGLFFRGIRLTLLSRCELNFSSRWSMGVERILLLFFCGIFFISGCATSGFARIKGRALEYVVPVYQGQPPEEYGYRSLGPVEGHFKGENNILYSDSLVYVLSQAMEDMANNAKAMGANAVINIKGEADTGLFKRAYHYTGEAVIFDRLPEDG